MNPAIKCMLVLCLCLTGWLMAQAQDLALRGTLANDTLYLGNAMKTIRARYDTDYQSASGENKKYIREIYKERFEYIADILAHKGIITDPAAILYIQKLVDEIVRNNPELNKLQPRVYLYKAWWPNASSLGEGTILFNAGALYKLRNEAQLAFILCHELAHLYLDHSNKAIQHYVQTVYSDEFQKELKHIARQTYEKNRMLDELEKSFSFKSRKHSRDKEREADSMAVEFMKNTRFQLSEATEALALLDKLDEDKYNYDIPLQELFHHPSYPFKPSWIKQSTGFFGSDREPTEAERQKSDTLKTHPDCKKRVAWIQPLVDRYQKPNGALFIDEPAFTAWQRKLDFEIIAYQYDRNQVSLALYQTLQTLKVYPNDPWLLAMAGNCLHKMYQAQKNHELGRIVDLPSPYMDKKYKRFLEFIQNLSLNDLGQINYYFLEGKKEAALQQEDFVHALIRSKENANKPEEKSKWIEYYKQHFTKPKYSF